MGAAPGRRALGDGDRCRGSRHSSGSPGARCSPFNPAGDPGHRQRRRLPVRGRGHGRISGSTSPRRSTAMAYIEYGAYQTPQLRRSSTRRSAPTARRSSRQRRPRRGARRSASTLSDVFNTLQIMLGLALRQRLRLSEPVVSRLRAGRRAVPLDVDDLQPIYVRSQQTGTIVPLDDADDRHADARRRRTSPLQPVPLDRAQRIGRRRGIGSGQAIAAMEGIAQACAPRA